jgi:hypothetical protein
MTLSRHAEFEPWMAVAPLRYFEVTGSKLFVIPNTAPQLCVAARDHESIVELRTSGAPRPT